MEDKKIDWFMLDLDDVKVKDITVELAYVTAVYDISEVNLVKRGKGSYHMYVLLKNPVLLSDVLQYMKHTSVDDDYIEKVKEEEMFFGDYKEMRGVFDDGKDMGRIQV